MNDGAYMPRSSSSAVLAGGTYSGLAALPAPFNAVRPSEIFDGWYTEPFSGTRINPTDTVDPEHTTLYAHWRSGQSDTVRTIFSTKHEATPWNWVLFLLLFGWIWMWF